MCMRRYTDEELLAQLVALAHELGRTPTYREVRPDGSTYTARFGSYNNAVLSAGLAPNVALPEEYRKHARSSIPLSRRFAVLSRDGFRCQYCGGTPQDGYVLHVDHRLAVSKGGTNEESNLITACLLCNNGKADT